MADSAYHLGTSRFEQGETLPLLNDYNDRPESTSGKGASEDAATNMPADNVDEPRFNPMSWIQSLWPSIDLFMLLSHLHIKKVEFDIASGDSDSAIDGEVTYSAGPGDPDIPHKPDKPDKPDKPGKPGDPCDPDPDDPCPPMPGDPDKPDGDRAKLRCFLLCSLVHIKKVHVVASPFPYKRKLTEGKSKKD